MPEALCSSVICAEAKKATCQWAMHPLAPQKLALGVRDLGLADTARDDMWLTSSISPLSAKASVTICAIVTESEKSGKGILTGPVTVLQRMGRDRCDWQINRRFLKRCFSLS